MIQLALLLLGLLFTIMLVFGLIRGRMPSKFGAAVYDKQPTRFYVNAFLIAFLAFLSFAAAIKVAR